MDAELNTMPTTHENLNANSKAIRLNRDPSRYGTIAEIGAGQEVARWFFRVGSAAGSIAKTMSAYDMTFSDAIYGGSDRYVSRGRLKSMLDHEYGLLEERLGEKRGKQACFFAFANTVAATSFKVKETGHGWMGIRFQSKPQAPPSDILMHVRFLDRDNVQQQEAAGILGVNLIYAAFHHLGSDDAHPFLDSLLDGINPDRVEIDVILGEGPDFEELDNRILNLLLVEKNMTHSVVFDPWGNVRHGSEMFYKKALPIQKRSLHRLKPRSNPLQRRPFGNQRLCTLRNLARRRRGAEKDKKLNPETDFRTFHACRESWLDAANKTLCASARDSSSITPAAPKSPARQTARAA